MSKPKNPLPFKAGDEIDVAFETMAHGGACKGTPAGMPMGSCAVFAFLAAPGDVARVRVREIKKNFVNADLVRVVKPSPNRVPPPCPIFHECGGCDWQHISDAEQMTQSEEIARYVLKRAEIDPARIAKTVPSPSTYQYRSRGDLSAIRRGKQVWIGFRKRSSHEMAAAHGCPQFRKEVSDAFPLIRKALLAADLEEGKIFRVRVVLDESTGRIAVMPQGPREEDDYLCLVMIDPRSGQIAREENPDPFHMKIDSYDLAYHPACFTQINAELNSLLVAAAVEAVSPVKEETVLELYSGIGNFTLPLAACAGRVIAVENSPLSHRYALQNLERYGPLPVRNLLQSAKAACRDLLASGDKIDKVLADPPRTGLGEEVVELVASLRPSRIVYVSCDVTSLATDLRYLCPMGFEVVNVTPFDMFPQTHHKELVAVLQANKARVSQ